MWVMGNEQLQIAGSKRSTGQPLLRSIDDTTAGLKLAGPHLQEAIWNPAEFPRQVQPDPFCLFDAGFRADVGCFLHYFI